MFISTPNNFVAAIDAKTGTVLWRYKRPRPQGAFVAHPSNRGLALYGDKVYYGAGEAVVVALDAKTGREVWAKEIFNNKVNYYITLAPLAADGKILVGASGGEFGVRGYVAALDPETGDELWRTYTVPAPGEPGSETWPQGEQWRTGGASVWVTGNYDPETNIAYWGTGNGGPWMGDQRPGDNLYVASTIALNASTGKLVGHFQYNPNESWDWDEVSPPILVDYRRAGRAVRGLINVARNGYLYFLERTREGPIRFVDGKPYVNQNVFRSIDPKTGRPDVDPDRKPGTGKEVQFCPSLHGGKNWPPISFSPETRMIYIPANSNLCMTMTGTPVTYTAGRGFTGVKIGGTQLREGAQHVGEVQAWNVDTGEKVWTHTYKMPNWGPMLATAGDLVFTGGTPDQKFRAFDAKSGKVLWEFITSSGVQGPPSSFRVDGKQYIAVLTGWGADARGMTNTVARFFPGEVPNSVPEGGAVYVFALE
jgi:alcohol dehydrogenase (cytochrome c)